MFYNIKHVLCFLCLFVNMSQISGFNLMLNRRAFLANSLLIPSASNSICMNNSFLNNAPCDYENDESEEESYPNNMLSINKYNNKRIIHFTGEINEATCFKLYEALIHNRNLIMTDQTSQPHIDLYIQSYGGALLPALGLSDEIKNLGVPVYTYVKGYAASAATLLSVVGTRRYMYNHSVYMIHGLKYGGDGQRVGGLLEARDMSDNTETLMNIIKDIYMSNSDIDEKTLEDMFMHDKWMNSKQVLEHGLIDKIL